VERLAGIPALNMLEPASEAPLDALLEERLGLAASVAS